MGPVAEMAGAAQQRRQRARILGGAMDDAGRVQERGIADVTAEAQRLAPEQRLADMAAAEQSVLQQSQADMGGIGEMPVAQGAGAVSQAFEAMRGQRAGEESARLGRIAQMLAATRAPGEVERMGAMRRGSMAEQLASMWRGQRNRANAAQMDADAVEMPLYGQIGRLATQIGNSALQAGALR